MVIWHNFHLGKNKQSNKKQKHYVNNYSLSSKLFINSIASLFNYGMTIVLGG